MSLLGESGSDQVSEYPEEVGELTQLSVPGGWHGIQMSVRWALGKIEYLVMGTKRVQIILSEPPPHRHPRASAFGLTSESYQPPWVVCSFGREKGTEIVGGVPNAKGKVEEKVLASRLRVD